MATTFLKKATNVIVSKGGNTYSVPAKAFIFPHPRNVDEIVISDEFNAQKEAEGLRVNITDVTGITFSDRNDLIVKLTELFFFDRVITTDVGGIAVRMINKTGSLSKKGTVVSASSVDDAVKINQADIPSSLGIVYDDGVSDGEYMYVVVSGKAQVLLQDGTASTAGYWAKISDTVNGRADITNQYPPGGTIVAIEDHLSEIGHCVETKGAGVDVLAMCVLHFN